jgi:hypothetical protein
MSSAARLAALRNEKPGLSVFLRHKAVESLSGKGIANEEKFRSLARNPGVHGAGKTSPIR